MTDITDTIRAEAVAKYLEGGKSQTEFCDAFTLRTGIPLSPRTLRSWVAGHRHGSAGEVPARTRAQLLLICKSLGEVLAEIKGMLGDTAPAGASADAPTPDQETLVPPGTNEQILFPPGADKEKDLSPSSSVCTNNSVPANEGTGRVHRVGRGGLFWELSD